MLLGRMVALCGACVLLFAVPAHAAAPVAVDDNVAAAPSVALDVLANDSDPDGDALTVSVTALPTNGTVTCAANGACLYRATAGYAGADSFTYTAADPGGATDPATVSITVTASTTAQAIGALDDNVATFAGTAIDFNVLANDQGSAPIDLQSATAASHGTATCQPTGACHYEPAAGFSGRDGFTYVLHDNGGETRTAAAHIAVAPAGATWALAAGGAAVSPEPGGLVGPGGLANWFASVAGTPAGLASDELSPLPRPSVSTAISGDHTVVGSSVAAGWHSTGAGSATATADALLGDSVSQLFPKPLPPISQGTGGDGHVPILVGSKVFAFFHHSALTSVTCVDRATGSTCPGYPKPLNVGASDMNGPGVVSGSKIWWHAMLSGSFSFTQSASIGLHCWDTATDSACGMTIVDRVASTIEQPGSHPVLAGGKIWFAANTGKLYCVEPDSGAPCATPSVDIGLTGGTNCMFTPSNLPCMDILTHGTRVFVSLSGDEVACLDVVTLAPCDGWATPKAFAGEWDMVTRFNTTGSITGICVITLGSTNGQCIDDATPQTTTAITNFPSRQWHYSATQEAETGTRTIVADLSMDGVKCYDWTTQAPCTGGGYDAQGLLAVDDKGNGLPDGYGTTFDGACAIVLGDPGQVYTVDPAGVSPCTSLRSGAGTKPIDLRTQRCDGSIGGARWRSVTLTDSDGTELDSMTVTVRDAQTGAVLLTGDLVTGGSLDLASIDPVAHPSIVVDAAARAKTGATPWDDGIPPRIVVNWTPDPAYVCLQTRGTDVCTTPAGQSSLTFNAHLAEPAADASAGLRLRRAACAAQDAADLTLACSTRRIVLTEVFISGRRVHLEGVANKKFAGQTVSIVFQATKKVVARAKVRPDGSFKATAPLPKASLRRSNKARYQARIGKERSLDLKLVRRMIVTSIKVAKGKVTIKGYVTKPLAKPIARVVLERRVSCKKTEKVTSVKPKRNGRFTIVVNAPAGQTAVVYRLSSRVRNKPRLRKLFPTFTLPRGVNLT